MKTGIKSQIVIVSAVAAVLLIVMSVCAIAESITLEKVAALAASALTLNKCCGMRNRETFGLSDHEVLNMAYDWSGKGLDFLYKRGWIAIRNPSMGNTFLGMDETKTATKAQVNTIFDYISKFNRYDMNVSKVMAD